LKIAKLGNSDAHILKTIGMGATQFEGCTAKDLIKAIRTRKTFVQKQKKWNAIQILGSWAASYIASSFTRLAKVS
jgi:hypothetical protein